MCISVQTFACDHVQGTDDYFLRADYRERCYTPRYFGYMSYAIVMCIVFTVGIPARFMYVLWRNRAAILAVPDDCDDGTAGFGYSSVTSIAVARQSVSADGASKNAGMELEDKLAQELNSTRGFNFSRADCGDAPAHIQPDQADDHALESTSFLWDSYTRKFYYWEVVECGRRLLLTGELRY
jgi:hypothetical protein